MTELRISPEFALPLEAVTETFAILGKRGKGKTATAVVMVEEMLGASLPVVVLDPVGVWWGLRSSADGTADGLPIVIFGGDHADLPLTEHSGELVADLAVDERLPMVLDLSGLSKAASRRFATVFLERLYHRNREALHLFVDEADAFAPQRATADGARLLGAMEDVVRRGRARGLGVTLITQRPAVLNKDVLTQAEVLIALGMTGPRDVAAIDEWVRLHADEGQAAIVKGSLPSLPVGTAWVWSPGWLDVLQKVQVRRRATFDSSATPKVGAARPAPAKMAPIDLDALGERITATREQAKADDPKTLKARIRDLEAELATERAKPGEVQVREVLYVDEAFTTEVHHLAADVAEVQHAASRLADRYAKALDAAMIAMARIKTGEARPMAETTRTRAETTIPATVSTPVRHESATGTRLPKAQRAILTVLAQHGPRTKTQLALLTGYASSGGGFNNSLSALRSAGYMTGPGVGTLEATITDAGREALGAYDPLPQGQALIDHWAGRLGRAERLILTALVPAGRSGMGKAELAAFTGYAATGGGFNNALSRLRSLELISGKDPLVIAEELAA